jgi:peptidyl-dipeptidase Dcp
LIFEARTGPHQALDFQAFSVGDFEPDLKAAIERARQRLQKIRDLPASFENTLIGLEECGEEIEFVYNAFSNLLLTDSSAELQRLAQIMAPTVSDFYNDILLDEVIFQKVDEVFNKRKELSLTAEEKMLLEKTHADFSRQGAKLDSSQKKALKEIDQKLAVLRPNFRQNVLKANNAFELWITDKKDLSGLPDSAIEAAEMAAQETGQWLITLHAPSYIPFMKYSDNRELREKLWRAYTSRAFGGEFDNQKNILEILRLTKEKMTLLGYENFAQFSIEKRMAETTQAAGEFLRRLLKASRPAALSEVAEIQKFATSLGGPDSLQPWDFSYYSEKLKAKKYDYEEESLRPYFRLENVIDGVMEHARKLYGLKFQKSDAYSVYNPEVEVFEVHKENNGEFIGLIYMDFFPRASKSQGAWMSGFLEQGLFQGEVVRPHVCVVCNFTKPTATKPSLLTFDEVSTLFHEFGHALHGLLSRCQFRSLSGTNVYLDFVELPSQIMENWLLEPESLRLFAKHYQTGEVLPEELITKVKAADLFLAGYASTRQVQFALLDLAWFTTDPDAIGDIANFEREATRETAVLPEIAGTNFSCSFSHIFGGGYAAGYYSYKWAEALDADAFEYFKEQGIFNPSVSRSFEENILSKGGSEHPMRLFEKFRGRKPDPDALLRRDGLLSP